MKDYYKILGIERDATAEQIHKAYRKLVKEYHPDVNKEPGTEQKYKDVHEAYRALIKTDKHKKYDTPADDRVSHRRTQHIEVTSINISPKKLSLKLGETYSMVVQISPENAIGSNVTWSSSNHLVATVSHSGQVNIAGAGMTGFKVTAVGAGKATIRVTTADGGFTDKCNVTVKAPAPKWALLMFTVFAILLIVFSNINNLKDNNPQENPQQPSLQQGVTQQQSQPPQHQELVLQPPQQQQRQSQPPQQQRPLQQEWILRLFPQQQRPIFIGIVTGDRVNIRSWPDTQAISLGMVNRGFKVEVIEEGEEWHKIQYLDANNIRNEGYISALYVIREGSYIPPSNPEYSPPVRIWGGEQSNRQQTDKFIEDTLRLLGISPNS